MTRPVVLLCLLIFGNTFAVGAFPVLLPDIGRAAGSKSRQESFLCVLVITLIN